MGATWLFYFTKRGVPRTLPPAASCSWGSSFCWSRAFPFQLNTSMAWTFWIVFGWEQPLYNALLPEACDHYTMHHNPHCTIQAIFATKWTISPAWTQITKELTVNQPLQGCKLSEKRERHWALSSQDFNQWALQWDYWRHTVSQYGLSLSCLFTCNCVAHCVFQDKP